MAKSTDQPDKPMLEAPEAKSGADRIWVRMWRARGIVGGLTAIGLGFLGQQALIQQHDWQMAQRYYVAAILILVLSLFHGNVAHFLGRFRQVTSDPSAASANPSVESQNVTDMAVAARPRDRQPEASKTGMWARWKILRHNLGWRMTGPGMAISLLFGGASCLVLLCDTASPLSASGPLTFTHLGDIKAGLDNLLYVLNNGDNEQAIYVMRPDGQVVRQVPLVGKSATGQGLWADPGP